MSEIFIDPNADYETIGFSKYMGNNFSTGLVFYAEDPNLDEEIIYSLSSIMMVF